MSLCCTIYSMAKVTYLSIPSGMEDIYWKGLQPGDRFTFSRVRIKDIFLSRQRIKGISQRSLMPQLKPVWAGFTSEQQLAWEDAGAESNLSGWKQFLVDTSERRKAGHSGYATPNTLYQSEVGKIFIESPATGLTIEQPHPLTYYVQKKVTGTRSQYSPVAVTEPFSFPLTISISWKSDLTALDTDARARFFCRVYSSYQGRTIETDVEIVFGLSDDWQRASAVLNSVIGPVQGYSAFIEVYNARGTLYFDNVSIYHGSENWARDPVCNNISQSFTKAFFQVAKHWQAVDPQTGSDFGSYYYI